MGKNNWILLWLFSLSFVQAQQVLQGNIMSSGKAVAGISVMNLVTEQVTVSDDSGNFSIKVSEGELLIFSSVNYEYKRRIIEAEDLSAGKISITLVPKVEKLDEVVVYHDISPESLGIPAGKKKYTPAERKHNAATHFNPVFILFPVPFVAFSIDPIINAISGRSKLLTKELAVEKKELYIKKLGELFPDDYFVSRLKIQPEYIQGFKYYMIYNPEFLKALDGGNKAQMEFIMAADSAVFNELVSNEKG
ncbi:carboxypeptidase-like regulatory domain-containing protein [Flavobacterium silvaticum]|uniref:Carboxypeptidase-like regulatory domain-containing protein n=1 Tax=Flavobacterium silvaticum TaxID=1852020 RepID=A0A972FKM6_9FLAO|nr:carboxypeptidase-like regulatory domain-containing protein [Flavobacterium silvaticum]NMH27498.1 hypothetical protein [Flavobacterium silvaticum]